jgi:hypothetical protein
MGIGVLRKARKLANHLERLDFPINSRFTYNHMGAIFTDAVLQAGLNYETVVRPRVNRILEMYPHARTTSSFQKILTKFGISSVVNWNHKEKIFRLKELVNFVQLRNIETEEQFRNWLAFPDNSLTMLEVRGVGPKTVDYLKVLVGMSVVAVDRHMFKIVKMAGINSENYSEVRQVISYAADLMDIERNDFDFSIWLYSSKSLNHDERF